MADQRITNLFQTFYEADPDPKSELEWQSPYTLLVAVVLSAQATDKSVNIATRELYKVADTPDKMVALGEEGLIPYVKSIGLFRSKAKHVIALSRQLLERYDGEVPHSRELLMELPGVGRKTANVVLNVVWHEPVMPVDTHVFRVAHRLGLSNGNTPEAVEQDLYQVIPEEYMEHAHHHLILHGRYICTARNPKCGSCLVADYCPART
ncbi:MAG: endonuclease III [Treponemataceae bacterium]|nr:endonuclease III [Treponemataceae bacterium]